jgi:hypothetical protein
MCIPAIASFLTWAGPGSALASTAAGATATAATAGGFLQGLGTILGVGGTIAQGIQSRNAYKQQAAAITEQKATEARLTATEDQRTRLQYRRAMRQQFAELAGRGISLDSPSVIALGQSAAQEMSFASQSVRSKGQATQRELSDTQRIALNRANSSMLEGTFSAAGTLLNGAPDIWPGLLA